MGKSPQRKPRSSSTPKSKKATRSWQRLQLMKGQSNDMSNEDGVLVSEAVNNDAGFKDVRTLQEKHRLLNWVSLHS